VLAYAYMYETEAKSKPIEAGIISFKNFYRLISKKKKRNMIINEEVMTNYLEQIVLLLNEILDVSIPFEEKV
jgi:uracil DNA glycosylase